MKPIRTKHPPLCQHRQHERFPPEVLTNHTISTHVMTLTSSARIQVEPLQNNRVSAEETNMSCEKREI